MSLQLLLPLVHTLVSEDWRPKVVNATAQAYAEKSPMIVISGASGTKEHTKAPLLHHMVRDYDTQLKIFEHITVDSIVLDKTQVGTTIRFIETRRENFNTLANL